ncbi:OPT oligopeptide transporter [Cyathus striatus]|nr:OPT oligopeptide transporter [Cyathus striatus]
MSTAISEPTIIHRRDTPNSSDYPKEKELEEGSVELVEDFIDDHDVSRPFPIEPHEVEETHQLTFRAIFVGCALGSIVAASNIYLGLKTGFTFVLNYLSIFGFAILKSISSVVPESGILSKIFGGHFGPKENCTVQTAATATGGICILFVSAIPAMYRLNLLSKYPQDDIGKLLALNVVSAFYGIVFVIPLRKYYIVHQKLTFPTPAATAYTIRSLHRGKSGMIAAKKKSLALLYSFCATLVFKVMAGYAPGVLYNWHIGWTLYRIGFTSMISLENYGWYIQFTPAFFGAGMLSGINASWSFFGGSIVAWGSNGLAFGTSISDEFPLVSYFRMSFSDPEEFTRNPSPRYWLLWPGIMIMLLYSFADIILSLGPLFKSIRLSDLSPMRLWNKRKEIDAEDEDQTPLEDRVPTWWWTTGLLISTVTSCVILAKLFKMNVGEAILALILGFIFSFIGVQSAGQTDVNPVSTVAKASQLILGGIARGTHVEQKAAQMLNLAGGVVAAGSAAQACDMTGDMKTGYLLRAKPRNQFIAQLCGATVSVFLTVGLFILFTKASDCILYPDPLVACPYGMPSVSAWAAVAMAVTLPKLPIPASSGYTAIALGIFSVVSVVVKHWWIPKKYWCYVPNWNAFGLAFVVPQVYYSIAMAFGSVFNYIWLKRSPVGYDMYMFAVSAGLLAGEGLGGVVLALLDVCGVGGYKYSSIVGCPGLTSCDS